MTLVRFKPFRDFLGMHENVNRLFEDEYFGNKASDNLTTWQPPTDIYEDTDKYLLKIEIPGMTDKDIDIEFNGDVLSVMGEKKEDKEVKKENYHRIESFTGKFSRSFSIPKAIASEKINAEMKNGILYITVPKAEEKKPKTIPIVTK